MKIIITEDQYRLLKETNMTEDNLYRFLYSLWDRQKKMGEEPHLDDVIYDVTGITKGSEEDNQTIRPIWFEYNGGYNNLFEKLKEELLNKELSFEGNQNLKLTFMVDDIESYDDGRWKGEVDITCHLLDGTVDGYAYDEERDEMVMVPNMYIGDQYAELEYDTQDFDYFLKEEIRNFLDTIMERYGILYHVEIYA
jgi:hypothetical protein